MSVTLTRFEGELSAHLERNAPGEIELYWLGQAGFIVRSRDLTILIDPYLSDSLAEKYRGTKFPHQRMMKAPISVEQLPRIDWVLVTHHHTDHMDSGTLGPLIELQPDARIIVPRASLELAGSKIGCETGKFTPIDAGETLALSADTKIIATPAAHEDRELDSDGHHRFLGYAIKSQRCTLWHSGDTVLFDGIEDIIGQIAPDITLLPVNGRSQFLRSNGVPGNLTLDEAVQLSKSVGAKAMIAHHYGMFDFNTIEPERIDAYAADTTGLALFRARLGFKYSVPSLD